MMLTSSRIFGFHIGKQKHSGFAPFADMLNHKLQRQTRWLFDEKRDGFCIEALADIKKGEQVYTSYGIKPNWKYLLNYGFINEINYQYIDDVSMILSLDERLYQQKERNSSDDNIEPVEIKKFELVKN